MFWSQSGLSEAPMIRNTVLSILVALLASEAHAAKKPVTAKRPAIAASAPKSGAKAATKSKPKKSSSKPARPPSGTAPAPTPAAEPVARAEEIPAGVLPVESYPLAGKAAEGVAAHKKGEHAKAVTALSAYRKSNPDGPFLHPLGLIELRSLLALKKGSEAISLAEALLAVPGPLTSEIASKLGDLYEGKGDAEAARVAYSKVERGSRRYDDARLARARLAPDLASAREILAERFYWAKERAESLTVLRGFAKKAGDAEAEHALALQLFREYPLTDEGDAVEAEILAATPTREDLVTRYLVYIDKKKTKEAAAYVKRVEAALGASDPVVIELRGDLALVEKDYKDAAALLEKAISSAGDKARATRRLGNVLAKKGEVEGALAHYREVYEAKHPEEAPRALLDAVRLLRDKDRLKEARPLAQEAADLYPDAPTRKEALWVSGWLAWRAGDAKEALARFDDLAAYARSMPAEERELEDFERRKMGGGLEERAMYWSARALTKLGDKAGAAARYREITERFPLNYYAHQSFDRLRDLGADDLLATLRTRSADDAPIPVLARDAHEKDPNAALVSALPGAGKEAGASTVAPESWSIPVADLSRAALADDPSVRAAAALYGLGLRAEAVEELRAQANQETLSTDGGALLGALMQADEGLSKGAWILLWKWSPTLHPGAPLPSAAGDGAEARQRLTDLGWKVAYPRAFGEVVDHYAGRFGVPPEMVFAIMRAESTFRPDVVSPANAVGLTQVLPSTAGWIAKELLHESKPSRAQLFDEQTNIKLGTRFMRELVTLFDGNYALAIASYNAGPGAGMRWYKRWKDLSTDELIEEIPINETHGYTKKVLGSMGAYRYLWGDWSAEATRSLDLPRLLPAKLGTYNGKQM